MNFIEKDRNPKLVKEKTNQQLTQFIEIYWAQSTKWLIKFFGLPLNPVILPKIPNFLEFQELYGDALGPIDLSDEEKGRFYSLYELYVAKIKRRN